MLKNIGSLFWNSFSICFVFFPLFFVGLKKKFGDYNEFNISDETCQYQALLAEMGF